MKPPRQPRTREDFDQLAKTVSNISFGTSLSNGDQDMNMVVFKATGTTPGAPNTEFAVLHTLTHIPIGFLTVSANKAAHLYKSTTPWTAATNSTQGSIYLKCDIATVVYAIVIL